MAAAAEEREYQRTHRHVVYDMRAADDDGAATITQAVLDTVTAKVNKPGAHLEVVVGYRDGRVEVLLQFQRKRSFVLRTRASDGSFEVKSLAHQGISAVTVTPPTVPCNRAHWDAVAERIGRMRHVVRFDSWAKADATPYRDPPARIAPSNMQTEVASMFAERYDPNRVREKNAFWLYDREGGIGKSTIAQIVKEQRYSDGTFPRMNVWAANVHQSTVNATMRARECDVGFFDCTRSHSKALTPAFYNMLEFLTNGWTMATCTHPSAMFRAPWIIVVANMPPDTALMRVHDPWKEHFAPEDYLVDGTRGDVEKGRQEEERVVRLAQAEARRRLTDSDHAPVSTLCIDRRPPTRSRACIPKKNLYHG